MPLYRDYRAASVYFMLFIGSGAFVAMNLILVVVLSEYRNSKCFNHATVTYVSYVFIYIILFYILYALYMSYTLCIFIYPLYVYTCIRCMIYLYRVESLLRSQ